MCVYTKSVYLFFDFSIAFRRACAAFSALETLSFVSFVFDFITYVCMYIHITDSASSALLYSVVCVDRCLCTLVLRLIAKPEANENCRIFTLS